MSRDIAKAKAKDHQETGDGADDKGRRGVEVRVRGGRVA